MLHSERAIVAIEPHRPSERLKTNHANVQHRTIQTPRVAQKKGRGREKKGDRKEEGKGKTRTGTKTETPSYSVHDKQYTPSSSQTRQGSPSGENHVVSIIIDKSARTSRSHHVLGSLRRQKQGKPVR